MKSLQIMIVVFVLSVGSSVFAQGVTPTYDITGIWRSADPGTAQLFQDGTAVKSIYVNRGFSHFFIGRYVNPTTIKGIQYRRNRSNGCMTIMTITFNVQSPDSITFDWEAKDSSCDLREGQKGSGRSQRDKQLEERTWY